MGLAICGYLVRDCGYLEHLFGDEEEGGGRGKQGADEDEEEEERKGMRERNTVKREEKMGKRKKRKKRKRIGGYRGVGDDSAEGVESYARRGPGSVEFRV